MSKGNGGGLREVTAMGKNWRFGRSSSNRVLTLDRGDCSTVTFLKHFFKKLFKEVLSITKV